jgi:riboflavin biosynthesis pyrimidine reductase
MDGRIALTHPATGEKIIPESITNENDWRLYQELAAQADILISSGRYMRDFAEGRAQGELPVSRSDDFADLLEWRKMRGLSPQPAVAVVTASLDLPWEMICSELKRPVYAVTTAKAHPEEIECVNQQNVKVIEAGDDNHVDGKRLIDGLANHGFNNIYVISGPKVLGTLIAGGVLDRLYLTQVHKLVGGKVYDTFLDSPFLEHPVNLKLRCLYQNVSAKEAVEQSFAVYDVCK